MASELTLFDASLIKDITFFFRGEENDADDPVLNRYGKAKKWASKFKVDFQFPPRIISDNRKGDWIEAQLRGEEPVAVFGMSGAREITLAWTYICGARGGSVDPTKRGRLYTPIVVAEQVRGLRSYFSTQSQSLALDDALVVYFRLWYHTGYKKFTCRINSVDVSYGRALIHDSGDYKRGEKTLFEYSIAGKDHARRTYALRTDVTAEMRLWTKSGRAGPAIETLTDQVTTDTESVMDLKDDEIKLDFERLMKSVPPDWQ